jgi:RNA polymerase sigma factor (sigma-70 family)
MNGQVFMEDDMSKDYRVTLKVQNNNILSLMEKNGIKNVAELSRICGLHQSSLGRLINMKATPMVSTRGGRGNNSGYSVEAMTLSKFFNVSMADLFNDQQMTDVLEKNSVSRELSLDEMKKMIGTYAREQESIEEQMDHLDVVKLIGNSLKSLTVRESKVIKARFGLDEEAKTLEECGEMLGVQKERIRQIEQKALRKLRMPSRCDELREYA